MTHAAEGNGRHVAIKIMEENRILTPVNVRAGFRVAEAAIFECHHGAGEELALAGSAAQRPVYPYQRAVLLEELEVIRQISGTGIPLQHVC